MTANLTHQQEQSLSQRLYAIMITPFAYHDYDNMRNDLIDQYGYDTFRRIQTLAIAKVNNK